MSLRDPSGLIRLPKQKLQRATSNGFERGDAVKILTGPLRGLIGLYEGQTSQERIIVLMDLLGRQSRVELALDDRVEALASQ